MSRYFWVTLFLCCYTVWAQNPFQPQKSDTEQNPEISVRDTLPKITDSIPKENNSLNSMRRDSLPPPKGLPPKKKKKKPKPVPYIKPMDSVTIKDYRILYMDESETYVDTTLTIEKEYRFNFLKKDHFELFSFANMGENYNRLGYDFHAGPITPMLGARATHFGYFEKEDVVYYEVPSPLTELFFKTTFEQGHHLDALITINTSPRFNLAFAYRGFRSLGKYLSSRVGASQLRISSQYQSYDKRYRLRFHFASQTLDRQVNGGLTNSSVYFFEEAPNYVITDANGDPVLDENGDEVYEFYDGFLDRSRLETQIRGENELTGKRYHLEQTYNLLPKVIDSTKTVYRLKLGHRLNYETKYYNFRQTAADDYFSANYEANSISDRNQLRAMENDFFANYSTPLLGNLEFKLHTYAWNYFFEANTYTPEPEYSSEIKTGQFAVSGRWKKKLFDLELFANAYKSLGSDFPTDIVSFGLEGKFLKNFELGARVNYRSQAPNFNFHLYKSDYTNYNWERTDFKNQEFSTLALKMGHKKWGMISAEWNALNHYAYFRNVTPLESLNKTLLTRPDQTDRQLDYFKIRLFQNLKFGKFALVNTIQYQKVDQEETPENSTELEPFILNVPEWITRNTVMFSSHLFKKAMYLQTGITLNFFTDYYADIYNPLIGEFASQNNTKIGNFPKMDVFLNAKIQQTRVFFKLEHFNSSQSGYRYYAAPFTPFRDSIIRFGLVWNFFQ